MRTPLRAALVVLGLAAILYGAASVTGGWLGRPPWWGKETALRSTEHLQHMMYTFEGRAKGPRRDWVAGLVVIVGLALATSGAWPAAPRGGRTVIRAARGTLVLLGLAGTVYGIASLTGGWLGTPPWWEERVVLELEDASQGGGAITHSGSYSIRRVPRQGRMWISAGVLAAGLGSAAVGAWPRRRRPNPAP